MFRERSDPCFAALRYRLSADGAPGHTSYSLRPTVRPGHHSWKQRFGSKWNAFFSFSWSRIVLVPADLFWLQPPCWTEEARAGPVYLAVARPPERFFASPLRANGKAAAYKERWPKSGPPTPKDALGSLLAMRALPP